MEYFTRQAEELQIIYNKIFASKHSLLYQRFHKSKNQFLNLKKNHK